MRTTPLRRTTLQLSHNFLTDARTFIVPVSENTIYIYMLFDLLSDHTVIIQPLLYHQPIFL